jgi:hypothetical protein
VTPILGFLGTVIHFGTALSGMTVENMSTQLNHVVSEMGTAFNTTTVALGAAMFTMFGKFLTERTDRGIDARTSIWLTRGGELCVGDADLAWFAAARTAFGRHGIGDPGVHVVTRYGWLDLCTGESRTWRRVRPLVGGPAHDT